MRVIIKMSIIQGSGLNGNWGLVRQIGPWKPTRRDRVGAGYTQGNEDVIRPYVVRGDKPPPKLSHWAQRNIVSKKAYDNGLRKSVPGMRYNAVSSSLLGISNTMLGIGARGSGGGVSQGNQNIDVNGRLGNDYGEEDASEEASIKSDNYEMAIDESTLGGSSIVGNLAQGVGSRLTGGAMGYLTEQGTTSLSNAFTSREAMAETVLRSAGLDNYVESLHGVADRVNNFWTAVERSARSGGYTVASSAASSAVSGDMADFAGSLGTAALMGIMNEVTGIAARAVTPTPERKPLTIDTSDSKPFDSSSNGSITPTAPSPNQDNVDRINEITKELETVPPKSKRAAALKKERTALKSKTTRNRKGHGLGAEELKRGY